MSGFHRRIAAALMLAFTALTTTSCNSAAKDRAVSSYPLTARIVAHQGDDALWRLSPETLDRVSRADTEQLVHTLDALDAAVRNAKGVRSLLARDDLERLSLLDRQRIRDVWASLFEPLVALDRLKQRYQGWYGLDYFKHPSLHARAFALVYAALCAQVQAGYEVLALVHEGSAATRLFDEAMPDRGLPSGTFRQMRAKLGRVRDQSYVPLAAQWYKLWISRHLRERGVLPLKTQVQAREAAALSHVGRVADVPITATNAVQTLQQQAFAELFPAQKNFSEWAGDTRFVPESRRLISDAQIRAMRGALRSGDIIVERRNWYLSNVGLPGFWPHAALFVGSPEEIARDFAGDAEVTARFGDFPAYLASHFPRAWASLSRRDESGHAPAVLEAVSEGVVASTLEHSCGADYVAAMRPALPKVAIAQAIVRAMSFFGRPYDFHFDFATDAEVVCSELVLKAYTADATEPRGVLFEWSMIMGKRVVAPTDIVRTFGATHGHAGGLDFVYFLDGHEREHHAVVASADELATSPTRPKWDVIQP